MSTKGGTDDPNRLAREDEKAAVARAKADLEAEREALRAEMAAIEEEERLEAERIKKNAIAASNSNSGVGSSESASTSPTPEPTAISTSKPSSHPTRTPKSSRNKTEEEDQNAEVPSSSTPPSSSRDADSKAERKEKKDKKKEKNGTNGEAIIESTPKQDRKKDRSETKSPTGYESPATPSTDKSFTSPRAERKEKKDKKSKTSTEGEGDAIPSSADTVTPPAEPKEHKDRPKKSTSPSAPHEENGAEAPKKPKDKTKVKDKSSKTSSSDNKEDSEKKEKTEKSEKAESGDKSSKGEKPEKKPKTPKDKSATASSSSSTPTPSTPKERPSSSATKTTLVHSDNQIPSAKDVEETASSKTAPRVLTRVESNLKIPVLDLSNRRIVELPLDISHCTYLTKLYLSRNQICDVSSLAPLLDLQVLNISNNSLSLFPAELCSERSKMKDLALADNHIASIPTAPASFKFPMLTKLDLMGNKLTEISPAITSVVTLTHLNMAWNHIAEIPKGISNLVLLTSLLLHHNSIKKIASGICQLAKLTTLEVQDNSLVAIPESIAELTALTSLDAARNQLKEWPTAFTSDASLSALIKLDLSHNQISGALSADKFPEDNYIFPAIEEIYLNHNAITELPAMFWRHLTNASVIDLRNNRLTVLSEEIENFFSLTTLELGCNLLTTVPAQLGQLGSLQVLSLYNNQITELPDISALEYLQYLNVGHNQLSEISLAGLSSLEEVFLSGNPIKQLPEEIGECCPNLKLLFAADMALKKVPASLSELSLLEQIDFSHNRISEIPPSLGELESLRSMSFAHCKLETSKEREVLKTPGKGPWDCIEFWQNFIQILEVNLSYNKLKYIPKGLETKLGTECDVVLLGNPLVETTESKSIFLSPQLGKRFQVGWAEMLGRRPTMEDHFLWQGALDGHSHVDLFAVFDGHAARDAAKFCSEHLPELVKQQLSSEHIKSGNGKLSKSDKFFSTIFASLNSALEKFLSSVRDSSVKHCGTTAVVVIVVGDTMQIANVGDSRAVLSNGERCTIDHKPRAEVDRIRSHNGGFVTGDGSGRINEVLAVSRSLGDFYMHPWVICEPHVYTKTLSKEDKFIILACDGVWDEVDDHEAVAIVEPLIQNGELFKAAAKLRDIAYCAGSDDNISVMVIKLTSK